MALSRSTTREYGQPARIRVGKVGAEHIYAGAFVNFDVSGYIVKASDSATDNGFAGIATTEADNDEGSAGDLTVRYAVEVEALWYSYSSAAQSDAGKPVYATADDTLATSASNIDACGIIEDVVSGSGWYVSFYRNR